MRNLFFAVTAFVMLGASSSAQNVKEYFYRRGYEYPENSALPLSGSACFFSYLTNGEMQEYEYWGFGNSDYALLWEYQVRPGEGQAWSTLSTVEYTLSYTREAVTSTSQAYFNQFSPRGDYRSDDITALAIPEENGQRVWTESVSGSRYTCSSEWAYLTDGEGFLTPAIKVRKTHLEYGITEISYWAKYYGKVWQLQAGKGEVPRTVKIRHGLPLLSEISKSDYDKEVAKYSFIREHKNDSHSIDKDSPTTYRSLCDAYDKYLVNLYQGRFVYHTKWFSSSPADTYRWINYPKDWRSYSLYYRTYVHTYDNGCECDKPHVSASSDYNMRVIDEYKAPSSDWASAVIRQCIGTGTYERASIVEPVSGYRLYFKTFDAFRQRLDISSHLLKFKKKKSEFVLIKGDNAAWERCRSVLAPYLEGICERSGKSSFSARIVEFSAGDYVRYALIDECEVNRDYDGYITCKLINLFTGAK